MSLKLNPDALKFAEQLIIDGHYRLSIPWNTVQPSAEKSRAYLQQQGVEAFSRWFLAVDPDETDPQARYQFPYGDFANVQRTGLMAIRQAAAKGWHADVEQAADELLELFDRLNAC